MTKKELAIKIAKEQNLDAAKLMRLSVVELEKMDLVVADDGDLLGSGTLIVGETGEATVDHSESPQNTSEMEGEEGPSTSGEDHKDGALIGYHPVTEEPVYL